MKFDIISSLISYVNARGKELECVEIESQILKELFNFRSDEVNQEINELKVYILYLGRVPTMKSK